MISEPKVQFWRSCCCPKRKSLAKKFKSAFTTVINKKKWKTSKPLKQNAHKGWKFETEEYE